MSDELDVTRMRIADRKRAELADYKATHPNLHINAAIRVAHRESRKPQEETEVWLASRAEIRQIEDIWVRYQVAREILIITGSRATDSEVAEALEVNERTVGRWRQQWRAIGIPDDHPPRRQKPREMS